MYWTVIIAYLVIGLIYGTYGVKIHQLNYHTQAEWYKLLGTFLINFLAWPANIIVGAYNIYKRHKSVK